MQVESNASKIRQTIMYLLLIACSALMVLPFLWMLSASVKLDKDVFSFPIDWIPAHPRWANYRDIWTTIPLGTFIRNTVKLTLIVTFLQLFTSSFAAYAFSKLHFKAVGSMLYIYDENYRLLCQHMISECRGRVFLLEEHKKEPATDWITIVEQMREKWNCYDFKRKSCC